VFLIYSVASNNFVLLNPAVSFVSASQIQSNVLNAPTGYVGTTVNNYVVQLTPTTTAINPGFVVALECPIANTGTAMLTVDSFGSYNIVCPNGQPLNGGEMGDNLLAYMVFDEATSQFVLLNSQLTPTIPNVQTGLYNYANFVSGSDDAYTLTFSPPVLNAPFANTFVFSAYIPTPNVGSFPVFNIGFGDIPVVLPNYTSLLPGDIGNVGQQLYLYDDAGGVIVLLDPLVSSGALVFGALATSPLDVSSTASLAFGTVYINAASYDVLVTVYVSISAATNGNLLLGVGTSTPSQQTIVSNLTTATTLIIPVPIYMPSQYHALLSTSGTITATISGQITQPI
jgi:hypothetical protein